MSWTYNQSNGVLSRGRRLESAKEAWGEVQKTPYACLEYNTGGLVSVGYSGFGVGKNNPLYEDQPNVGPIPRGAWKIVGEPFDSPDHGPFCLRLAPGPDTQTFNRSGFLIHGDSIVHPGLASKGCIILLRAHREEIWQSGDCEVTVF